MRHFILLAALSFALFGLASPVITQDSVVLTQDTAGLVTIDYNLANGPAIVTVDIQTNVTGAATDVESDWISIGERCFRNVTGDVNKLVAEGGRHTILWDATVGCFAGQKAARKSCRAVVTAWPEVAPPDYMVVDLRRDAARDAAEPRVRYYTSTNSLPEEDGIDADAYRNGFMVMRLIRHCGAQFMMGSPSTEKGHQSNEDLHVVRFSEPDFYMAVFPLTIGQCLNIGSWYKGDQWGITDIKLDGTSTVLYQYHSLQADEVQTNRIAALASYANLVGGTNDDGSSWPGAGRKVNSNSVCGRFKVQTGIDFDIATDAQWEFACRAGTTSGTYNSDPTIDVDQTKLFDAIKAIGWIDGNTSKTARHVGLKPANAWGLYDMIGTVFEFVRDRYQKSLGTDPMWDPVGPADGSTYVLRGGSYKYSYTYARSAARTQTDSSTAQSNGGRLICPVGLTWTAAASAQTAIVQDYTLTEPAIVTFDVQTNRTGAASEDESDWVSVGDEHLASVIGDVNTYVTDTATSKRICWRKDGLWPEKSVPAGAWRTVVRKWAKSSPPDYMVVDLDTDVKRVQALFPRIRYFTSAKALPEGGLANDVYRTRYLVMRRIPSQGTTWCMGSPTDEIGHEQDETQHYVSFTDKDFYLGIYALTDGQYFRFSVPQYGFTHYQVFPDARTISGTKDTSSTYPAPVGHDNVRGAASATVGWPKYGHAVAADSVLGMMRERTGLKFDLPTEAMWEFACRAGTGTALSNGKNLPHLTGGNGSDKIAWYQGHDNMLHTVGELEPNPWGLYDVHGLAFEYCLDWYAAVDASPATNPVGPTTGDKRVTRGGTACGYAASYARSAARNYGADYCSGCYGVRLACPVDGDWDPVVLPKAED